MAMSSMMTPPCDYGGYRETGIKRCWSAGRLPVAGDGDLAELAPQHLPQEVFWQLADHLDLARALMLAEMLLAMAVQRSHVELAARARHHQRLDELAAFPVRHADHGGVDNTGEGTQDFLNLRGVDQESGGLDDVFLAIDKREVAVPIAPGHVARIQPAIAEDLGSLIRVVEVTLHHLRAAHDQLADGPVGELLQSCARVHHPGVRVGEREANGARAVAFTDGVGVGDGAGLGQAVAFHYCLRTVAFELRAHGVIESGSAGNDRPNER